MLTQSGRPGGATWRFAGSVDEYAERVVPFLATDPERNTISLTVIESVQAGVRWSDAEMYFGWYETDGTITGAATMTPPFPLLLAALPAGSEGELVDALRAAAAPVTGVNGEREPAERFAAAWTAGTTLQKRLQMEQRLYRLGTLIPPDPAPPGAPRRAASMDVDLVTAWSDAFDAESGAGARGVDHRDLAARRIEDGLVWLWERAGEPVAMAGRQRTAAGVARVGPVYTPPEHRRQGYGAAVTARCTQDALDCGAGGVVLFTDLANPTSNAIYQAIGYRPVGDRLVLRFE